MTSIRENIMNSLCQGFFPRLMSNSGVISQGNFALKYFTKMCSDFFHHRHELLCSSMCGYHNYHNEWKHAVEDGKRVHAKKYARINVFQQNAVSYMLSSA